MRSSSASSSARLKKALEGLPEVILESLERLVPMYPPPSRPVGLARPSLCLYVFWSCPQNPLQRPGAYLHGLLELQPSVPAYSWSLRIYARHRQRDEGDGPPYPDRPLTLLA